MHHTLIRSGLGAALFSSLLLLGACSSNEGQGPFTPAPTPTATPVPSPTPAPSPTPVFMGSSASFVDFLRDLPLTGDPLPVNDGAVRFTDTAGDTEPVSINN